MILAPLASASLVVTVAIGSATHTPRSDMEVPESMYGKSVAVRPLVRSATECVARTVASDPRFHTVAKTGDVNELIVESMSACTPAMRAMIDAYDRYFGRGMGETFFLGPYLDRLPGAVHTLIKDELSHGDPSR
jgi:hypothetical protein